MTGQEDAQELSEITREHVCTEEIKEKWRDNKLKTFIAGQDYSCVYWQTYMQSSTTSVSVCSWVPV